MALPVESAELPAARGGSCLPRRSPEQEGTAAHRRGARRHEQSARRSVVQRVDPSGNPGHVESSVGTTSRASHETHERPSRHRSSLGVRCSLPVGRPSTGRYPRARGAGGRGGAGPSGRRHPGRGGRAAARRRGVHPLPEARPRQRPDRHPARGRVRPAGARGRDLPRRLGPRGGRQVGLRALLRAHDVPGLDQRRRRPALPHRLRVGRPAERHHQQRPHQLLPDRARQPAREAAVARGRPHGLPPRRGHPGEVRGAARHRQERARPARRQRPLRPDGRAGGRGALPRGAPVLVVGDRLRRGPRPGRRGRPEGVLPALVRAEQRGADHRRRFRRGGDPRLDREVLRPHPAGTRRRRAREARRHPRRRPLHLARGQRGAAADADRLPHRVPLPPRRGAPRRADVRARASARRRCSTRTW